MLVGHESDGRAALVLVAGLADDLLLRKRELPVDGIDSQQRDLPRRVEAEAERGRSDAWEVVDEGVSHDDAGVELLSGDFDVAASAKERFECLLMNETATSLFGDERTSESKMGDRHFLKVCF